ncbi:MAG: rhodanese-like domain-containing protein [Planctomycetota bacterium]
MAETAPLEILPTDLASRLKSDAPPPLIDCREPREVEIAMIEGAKVIPMSEIGDRLPELEELKPVEFVVYCHHGARSASVANWLRAHGFDGARSLSGGIDEWSRDVDPSMRRY